MEKDFATPVVSDDLRSRSLRASVWGLVAFLGVLCAIASAAFFDAIYSSKDGIAVSMMFACAFALVSVYFGVKALYFFFRYRASLGKGLFAVPAKEKADSVLHKKIEALSRFVERHESGVAKVFVFAVSCGMFGFWMHPVPEDWSTESVLVVWGIFLMLLLPGVCTTEFRLSSFPFMKTQWLAQRPLARCVVLLVELAVVALAFVFITLFSLFFTIIVTAIACALVGAVMKVFR